MIEQVSIRDLRQNASVWLRRVEKGEAFEITDRGRPIAILGPVHPQWSREWAIATGRLIPGIGDPRDLGPALPPTPGVPLPSEVLEEMRADER